MATVAPVSSASVIATSPFPPVACTRTVEAPARNSDSPDQENGIEPLPSSIPSSWGPRPTACSAASSSAGCRL
ncbi:hypothetical protein DF18_34420 [Streptomyces rimosus]|nr:hypothetical protein DF18_34420 [Streptomyces rimosus]